MRDRTGSWSRVPSALRLAGLVSGCLLLVAGGVYVLGSVAARLASLSIAIVAAVLVTALLQPLVGWLNRLRVPRGLSALAAILLFVAVLIAPAVLLWRLTVNQFDDLSTRLQQGLERTKTLITGPLPVSREQVDRVIADVQQRLTRLGPDPLSGALTALEALAAILLALFVAFFLLKEGAAMWGWFVGELPDRARAPVSAAATAGWATITGYIHGTLIVGAIDALGIGVALAVIGVPLALPLALLVFVGGLVPYIGATVSGCVAVLVALAANGPGDALLTLAAVVAVQQLEGNLLEPLIVGRQVRLHPVAVVIVVFAGSLMAGIVGAIVAVPLVAVAYRVYRVRRDRPPEPPDEAVVADVGVLATATKAPL